MYVRIQELATGENDDRKDKRLSNLIRDIEFTDTAGDETRGMYRYDSSSVDHMIG